MFIILWRTFRESLNNFFRNGWLSVATVSILMLALFVLGFFYVSTLTINDMLKNIQDKINVSVYFKSDVSEKDVLEAMSELEQASEVKSVGYVSKEQALEDFRKSNENEPSITQSLDELGENPLLASLVIKAKQPDQYDALVRRIEEASFKKNISRINYKKTKEVINNLNNFVETLRGAGTILGALFSLISILITFNAIRITIYTYRQEIEIMRLVGASNMFIRFPFIFEGILYGLGASLASMFALFVVIKFAAPYVFMIIPHVSMIIVAESLMSFYRHSFWTVLGLQIAIGSGIGVISSWIAMRKYLKM